MSVNMWQINDVSKVAAQQPGPPKQKEWWGTYESRYEIFSDVNLENDHIVKRVDTGQFSFKIFENASISGIAKGNVYSTLDTKRYVMMSGGISKYINCHGEGSDDVTFPLVGTYDAFTGNFSLLVEGSLDLESDNKITVIETCSEPTWSSRGTLSSVHPSWGWWQLELKNGAEHIIQMDETTSKVPQRARIYDKYTIVGPADEKPLEKITVDVSRPELSPLEKPIPIDNKVTVTAMKGDTPLSGSKIEVKACTEPGKAPTPNLADADGHTHDKRTGTDPCVKGNRPVALLVFGFGKTYGNPIEVTTNEEGKAELWYIPPNHPTPNYNIFISGKDKIIATSKLDPKVKGESSITTKVPGLLALAGSSDCKGTGQNYFFESQGGHGCLFYGTSGTNEAIIRIADNFAGNQTKCIRNYFLIPGGTPCIIKDDKNADYTVTTSMGSIKVIPMKITAMSLPWGGLLDIGPKGCKKCVEWKPPHNTHTSGKELDIGFANLLRTDGETETISCTVKDKVTKKDKVIAKKISYDKNRILLLRHIITQDPNFGRLISYEGGTLATTFCQDAPHIHVDFKK
jgi:hypothetical protein